MWWDLIVDDPNNWPPPYIGKGYSFDLQDSRESPIIGYRSMSHWNKDLSAMQYTFEYLVRFSDEKIKTGFDIHLKLMEKFDPHRPLYFLFRLVRRLIETGASLEGLSQMFIRSPENTVAHQMAHILKRSLERNG